MEKGWNLIDRQCPGGLDSFNNQTSVYVSGALHWLGWVSSVKEARQQHYMILSFDVNNDNFGEIALPDGRTTATTRSNEETKTSDGVQGETGHHHI